VHDGKAHALELHQVRLLAQIRRQRQHLLHGVRRSYGPV
jgi:hypothetical protein